MNCTLPVLCLLPLCVSDRAKNMASNCSSYEEVVAALMEIPNNLRGITWLTVSQLALAAKVSVSSLNDVSHLY